MKNNAELQRDVQTAIAWEPLLTAAEIGVTVKDGVVSLTGAVDSYAKKAEAENAAKGVIGVKAVVEEIKIKFNDLYEKITDNEIATEILKALKWNTQTPSDKIKIKVENGWVTLEGELEWNYQKEEAKDIIKNLSGVMGIINNISIKSNFEDKIEKSDIESALSRNSFINTNKIKVKVANHAVTLTGEVRSWFEKDKSSQIAWKAKGVWTVNNDLAIEYIY
jgi:osmotically-inducible protein OsmY